MSLDLGLVSEVPQKVRDGLVAAVALLVFARDYAVRWCNLTSG